MRILLLSAEPPLPMVNGIRLRTYHLFSRLAREHEITLLTLVHSPEDLEGIEELKHVMARVDAVGSVKAVSVMDYVRYSLSTAPFFVERLRSECIQRAVSRELATKDYDLLFVNDLRVARYAMPRGSIPRVFDACDALSLLYRRAFAASTRPHRRLHFLQLWLKTRRYESRVCERFDLCTAVSPVDAATLQRTNPRIHVAVVPNGIDTVQFHPVDTAPSSDVDERALVFVGVLDFPPNVDAVRHFAIDVLPRIRQEMPSVHFLAVGRNGSADSLGLQETEGVRILGTVPDIRPFVWKSAVFVCPMRFGSGVKNKVLEAMAMAKAIVGTPLAFEGLEIVPGEHAWVARGPDEFARSIIALLQDAPRRIELGRRARELAEGSYSWETAADLLNGLMREIVSRRAGEETGMPVTTRPDSGRSNGRESKW